jgi:hypothetical protein
VYDQEKPEGRIIMKRVLGLVLLFFAFNASAIEISSRLSGIWYNPAQSGHGLNIAVLDENTTIVYWYVYHIDGTPMFLITVGQNDGNKISGPTYYNTGMKFGEFKHEDIDETVWGSTTLTFSDCNNASLEYFANDAAYGSGTIPMQRLGSVEGLKCSDSPLHGNYQGTWAQGGEVGYGIATLFANGDMVFWAASDTSGEVGIGTWWADSDHTFQFNGTSYSIFGGASYIAGSGNFSEDDLFAYYTGGGYLFASPMQSFQHGLTTADLAGVYDVYAVDGSFVGTITVQADGTLSGSVLPGCQVSGSFIVPDTNFNQAYLNGASISGCGDTIYGSGAAIYRNATGEIVVGAASDTTGYAWTLKPQQ